MYVTNLLKKSGMAKRWMVSGELRTCSVDLIIVLGILNPTFCRPRGFYGSKGQPSNCAGRSKRVLDMRVWMSYLSFVLEEDSIDIISAPLVATSFQTLELFYILTGVVTCSVEYL